MNFSFETNPNDDTCHQRIRLTTQPLTVIFDWPTFQRVANMFQSAEASELSRLQAAARQTIEDMKKTSLLGLEYAIQNRTVVDVDVNIRGSYVVVPIGGALKTADSGKMVCNTGNLVIRSLTSRKLGQMPSVSRMVRSGNSEDDIMSQMMAHSYDRFAVELQAVRLLSLLAHEDWKQTLRDGSHGFILRPMSINLVVEKCLVLDDPRLPKLKVSATLPSIHLDFVDVRLVNMASVLKSFPRVSSDAGENAVDAAAAIPYENRALEQLGTTFGRAGDDGDLPLVQATDLWLHFDLQHVRVDLSVQYAIEGSAVTPLVVFNLDHLAVTCSSKTFDTGVVLTLKDLSLQYYDQKSAQDCRGNVISLITSRSCAAETAPCSLLNINYLDVDRNSPEFVCRYKSVSKKLQVGISSLVVEFHQEALIDIIHVATSIGSQIETIANGNSCDASHSMTKLQPAKKIASEGTNTFSCHSFYSLN